MFLGIDVSKSTLDAALLQEGGEFFHAVFAVAPLRMHRGIVEEDAVVSGLQLLAHHKQLVGSPVRMIHAGRLIIASVP